MSVKVMPAFVDAHHLVIILILVETYRTPIVDSGCLASGVNSAGQISLELRWEVLGFSIADARCETKEAFVGDVHVVIVHEIRVSHPSPVDRLAAS